MQSKILKQLIIKIESKIHNPCLLFPQFRPLKNTRFPKEIIYGIESIVTLGTGILHPELQVRNTYLLNVLITSKFYIMASKQRF